MRTIGFCLYVATFALGILFATFVPSWWSVFLVLAMTANFGITALVTRRRLHVLVFLAFLACALGSARFLVTDTELPPSLRNDLDSRITYTGTIVTQPDVRETSTRLTIRLEGENVRIIAVAQGGGSYKVGDMVTVSGTLTPPKPFATDGGRTFAYDKFLAKDGVLAVVQPARVQVVGREQDLALSTFRFLQEVRDGFIRALNRALPEPESALAAGLIVGGKQGLGKPLLEDFTTAGLIHIVVLSGYNVTIVAEAILRALGFLPRKVALACACSSIALFVLAAGAGSAATRAGTMALLGLVARATGRAYEVVFALFLTLLGMLLLNPLLLVHDPGFQFSFLATLGLILLSPMLLTYVSWIPTLFMREVAASTLAAQIGVLPILLYQTGNFSLVSFGVNLIVLPVIPLAMALSTLAAFAGLVVPPVLEPLVLLLSLPAYALLTFVIHAAEVAARLPLASVIIPAFPFVLVLLAYLMLAFWIWKSAPKGGALPASL